MSMKKDLLNETYETLCSTRGRDEGRSWSIFVLEVVVS